MVAATMANTITISKMDMECTIGLMDASTLACGKMESSMAKVDSRQPVASKGKELGKMASALIGLMNEIHRNFHLIESV